MFVLLVLLALRKDNIDQQVLTSFSQWNWISLMSVCVLICLIILFIFQMFFKAKTPQIIPQSFGGSILEESA